MRKRNGMRMLGWAVATVAAGAFLALPASAEEVRPHNQRPPRPTVEHPVRVQAPHAVHKPPPSFAPQTQDHPAHKPHPTLNAGPPKGGVVVHVRAPHKNHRPAPVVVTQVPGQPRKEHVIVHSFKIVNKPAIELTKRGPGGLSHPSKVNGGTVKH